MPADRRKVGKVHALPPVENPPELPALPPPRNVKELKPLRIQKSVILRKNQHKAALLKEEQERGRWETGDALDETPPVVQVDVTAGFSQPAAGRSRQAHGTGDDGTPHVRRKKRRKKKRCKKLRAAIEKFHHRMQLVAACWEFHAFSGFLLVFGLVLNAVQTYPALEQNHTTHTLDTALFAFLVIEQLVLATSCTNADPLDRWFHLTPDHPDDNDDAAGAVCTVGVVRDSWGVACRKTVAAVLARITPRPFPICDTALVVMSFWWHVAFLRVALCLRWLEGSTIKPWPRVWVASRGVLEAIRYATQSCALLFLSLLIFGVAGMHYFQENDPVHFGSLAVSLLTLFRVVTGDWADVFEVNEKGCNETAAGGFSTVGTRGGEYSTGVYSSKVGDFFRPVCFKPTAHPAVAPAFFVSFMVVGCFFLSISSVAVVVKRMEEAESKFKVNLKLRASFRRLQDKCALARRKAVWYPDPTTGDLYKSTDPKYAREVWSGLLKVWASENRYSTRKADRPSYGEKWASRYGRIAGTFRRVTDTPCFGLAMAAVVTIVALTALTAVPALTLPETPLPPAQPTDSCMCDVEVRAPEWVDFYEPYPVPLNLSSHNHTHAPTAAPTSGPTPYREKCNESMSELDPCCHPTQRPMSCYRAQVWKTPKFANWGACACTRLPPVGPSAEGEGAPVRMVRCGTSHLNGFPVNQAWNIEHSSLGARIRLAVNDSFCLGLSGVWLSNLSDVEDMSVVVQRCVGHRSTGWWNATTAAPGGGTNFTGTKLLATVSLGGVTNFTGATNFSTTAHIGQRWAAGPFNGTLLLNSYGDRCLSTSRLPHRPIVPVYIANVSNETNGTLNETVVGLPLKCGMNDTGTVLSIVMNGTNSSMCCANRTSNGTVYARTDGSNVTDCSSYTIPAPIGTMPWLNSTWNGTDCSNGTWWNGTNLTNCSNATPPSIRRARPAYQHMDLVSSLECHTRELGQRWDVVDWLAYNESLLNATPNATNEVTDVTNVSNATTCSPEYLANHLIMSDLPGPDGARMCLSAVQPHRHGEFAFDDAPPTDATIPANTSNTTEWRWWVNQSRITHFFTSGEYMLWYTASSASQRDVAFNSGAGHLAWARWSSAAALHAASVADAGHAIAMSNSTQPKYTSEGSLSGDGLRGMETLVLLALLAEFVLRVVGTEFQPRFYFKNPWHMLDLAVLGSCALTLVVPGHGVPKVSCLQCVAALPVSNSVPVNADCAAHVGFANPVDLAGIAGAACRANPRATWALRQAV
jgi:hypothetical protein